MIDPREGAPVGRPRPNPCGADLERSYVMRSERLPTRRLVLAVIVLAAGGALWLTHAVDVARAEAREWREERGEAKIVGKRADEIIATFGTPYAVDRGPEGKPAFILYKQVKHGQYCCIAIKDGVAVSVSFSFQ